MKKVSTVKGYIAYKGKEFTIEWYFNVKGESHALEYFKELTDTQKNSTLKGISFLFLNLLQIDFFVFSIRAPS